MFFYLFKLAIISLTISILSALASNSLEDDAAIFAIMMDDNTTSSIALPATANLNDLGSFEEELFHSSFIDNYFEVEYSNDNGSVESYVIRNASKGIWLRNRNYHWQVHPNISHSVTARLCNYGITDKDEMLKQVIFENGTHPNALLFECYFSKCCGLECCVMIDSLTLIGVFIITAIFTITIAIFFVGLKHSRQDDVHSLALAIGLEPQPELNSQHFFC